MHLTTEVSTVTMILCSSQDLYTFRTGEIRQKLVRVSSAPFHVDCATRQGSIVFAVRHGTPASAEPRHWTFPSNDRDLICQYREVWNPRDAWHHEFSFASVIFHLLIPGQRDNQPKETVLFHWHPTIADHPSGTNYHQRPHFHMKNAPHGFGKVHVVNTLAMMPSNQNTKVYLDSLLDDAIELLADEVLDAGVVQ